MSTNQAAWLNERKGYPFQIASAPMPTPRPHELTIRVHAVAINPVDGGVQATGMVYNTFPRVLGIDAAGTITAVGSAVKAFQVGDRVMGIPCVEEGDENEDHRGGTFQLYCNISESMAVKLPEGVAFKDAAVLPLGMCTACVGLFEDYNLDLPYPKTGQVKVAGDKVVLIWGGASSVGSCGIQAVKAAGLQVATTASAHNHEYCRSLGADYVFDYKSETVVEDVVAALKGKEFGGVFAAVMGEEVYIKSAEIAVQLGGKQLVATVLPDMMKYEKPLPGGVQLGYNYGDSLRHTAVGPAIWKWTTDALADGSLKCKPDAYVVGKGLESVQEAVDLIKKGASARKYVVELA
ncbi:quinone reductase [Neohortaea acidophila]|uniref:Quinone reductase n=1 Tax=Neohortaea acidophila TaxID=245834 RepID=A0A6A6PM51_9PEZI|nr:quinone reductase [Neohortaea acidophila]KAF2481178.1 quinone reductase [Neohortaea acidophila]